MPHAGTNSPIEVKSESTLLSPDFKLSELNLIASQLAPEIRLKLSVIYKTRLLNIERELSFSTKETIQYLIDFYLLDEFLIIKKVRQRLLAKLAQGMTKQSLTQLKLLYTGIGHILKKLRYL